MAARDICVLPVLFKKRGADGDFKYMSTRPEHTNSVFILAENYRDMLFFTDDGGGTAALRTKTWPNTNNPCAVGVPTGWSQETGGFASLLPIVRTLVDLSIDRVVVHLIEHPHVNTVIYSADSSDDSKIGVGIFKTTLSVQVRDYISDAIHDIPLRFAHAVNDPNRKTMEELRELEITAPVPAFMFAEVIHGERRATRAFAEMKTVATRLKQFGKQPVLNKKSNQAIQKPGRIQTLTH